MPTSATSSKSALVVGAGVTGQRIATHLQTSDAFSQVELHAPEHRLLSQSPRLANGNSNGTPELPEGFDIAVIATPSDTQAKLARAALATGAATVTTTNEIAETKQLLDSDAEAKYHEAPLIVGAAFMPGYTCLLARLGASELTTVDEIHVAKAGTGGPACARQHHRALSSPAIDWRDGRWQRRVGGSGRELCWFPDPVAGRDCYRGALPDALLLVPAFDGVDRVTARMAATRRDRLTAPLPMLRRPHPEGGVGAVRVELRGWSNGERRVVVLGACERPASGAAFTAAATAIYLATHKVDAGARGLASLTDYKPILSTIAELGMRPSRFEGVTTSG